MTGSPNTANEPNLADATSVFDALLEPAMQAALSALDGPAPILPGMANYHLGFSDADFNPAMLTAAQRGKRLRPGIAMLACSAAGGDPAKAASLAAAIELLHNFTLVHDDIQDQSPSRRHRATVWTLWGVGQAINAGDAIFAAAHRALYRLRDVGVDADLVIRLAEQFDTMTIQIVQGQSLDLGFEGRNDVTPDDYLKMIELKTAVIVRFAAWAGALLAGADDERAELFGAFGLALGVGFQVRDDLLGIWGASEITGKAAADDIRRRKQSLPILILRDRASVGDLQWLDAQYAVPEIDEDGVRGVLAMLERYEVRREIEMQIEAMHDSARVALSEALDARNRAGTELESLVDVLAVREH
jgi:geranylgeranyl diphosphate synthase type I